jgi:Uma2 family endonuclease
VASLTIALRPHAEQAGLNLRRWTELLADAELARFPGRVETDRHGHTLMTPPPAPKHGALQFEVAFLLRTLSTDGRVFTECPVSTSDGVKTADVAWASPARLAELGDGVCFVRAPEICVEVLSPSNSVAEIEEKKALYFDAGASEVWVCADDGSVQVYLADAPGLVRESLLIRRFPPRVQPR